MKSCSIKLLTSALLAVASTLAFGGETVLYDFEEDSKKPRWEVENDGVMGGVSKGEGKTVDGTLIFQGRLSLENDGGFASLQTEDGDWDLSKSKGIVLRVKGDGRSYQFRVATDARFKGSRIDYAAEFQTKKGEWIEVVVPFSDMEARWRGEKLDEPKLDLKNVEQLRIYLGDGKEGPFMLEVDWIKTSG
ncbi:CIA30 family protein [Haloferula sp.]|uniref:CIA30 family protein n=1 Tax=Haloferula sp. TaxID=2497595 RepID=UPI003C7431AC